MRVVGDEGRVVWSASDLKAAAECEFAWMRSLDAKLDRIAAVAEPEDATQQRAAILGDVHEHRVLAAYVERFGRDAVVELPRVLSSDQRAMADVLDLTAHALASDARVVFQAAFQSTDFVGFADFLLRDDNGTWRVQDSKLARSTKVTALMQLAAYVDQLDQRRIARSNEVDLILGDATIDTPTSHRVADLLPLFFVRRRRLRALISDREPGSPALPAIAWGDDRGDLSVFACGRCATCTEEVEHTRDLLLVARMRPTQRTRLRAAGISTIDELAVAAAAPEGMNAEVFNSLAAQARVQVASVPDQPPAFEVYDAGAVHSLPRPNPGDIFFDFEGDPLYSEPGTDRASWLGLDYLFGWTDTSEQYSCLWAHDYDAEEEALGQFLDFVAAQRAMHPEMHIYHYAPYETAHLLAMAARHGIREAEVDTLLRDGVFVDLFPLVVRAVRVGSRSYSIKKLEPLYMGDEVRTADVQQGGDSIVQYAIARELLGERRIVDAQVIFDDLADYNRYDCVSTGRLRNWLIARGREHHVFPAPADERTDPPYESPQRSVALLAEAEKAELEGRDGLPYRFAAAAVDYFPREQKTFWASHFQRLREPSGLWGNQRDVMRVDSVVSRVVRDWSIEEGKRVFSREIEVRGDIAPGTTLGTSSDPFALYLTPAPFPVRDGWERDVYVPRTVAISEVLPDGYRLFETAIGGETWPDFPAALTPPAPPRALSLQGAIEEWGERLIAATPELPHDAATDILLRRPPRLGGEMPRPENSPTDGAIATIVTALLALQNSYVAIQGPPGTGKTYTGSHVVARLVQDFGFTVGVVAQSHTIVENFLSGVVNAGLDPSRVAKNPKDAQAEHPFTVIEKDGVASFLQQHPEGAVIGGTAWDMSNVKRIGRKALDLLVVDEAGQFSLASTIAVAAGAKNLLLLGDPQQLPQVSQGTHPVAVDTSALGWVMEGDDVLRPEYGYFLERSWRMHPAVAEPVSELSYDGKLRSAEQASLRSIDGVRPGLHLEPVLHRGNATESPQEAHRVVHLVSDLLGREFTSETGVSRPLDEGDIIVVAPYNAQKQRILDALADAGFTDIPVGTVDNFQGKEAVVSITSLAASSGRDAPRGPEFLLLPNRLNVAISRAQVAAYLVYSSGLLDDLPRHVEGVTRLSAFARLVGADRE